MRLLSPELFVGWELGRLSFHALNAADHILSLVRIFSGLSIDFFLCVFISVFTTRLVLPLAFFLLFVRKGKHPDFTTIQILFSLLANAFIEFANFRVLVVAKFTLWRLRQTNYAIPTWTSSCSLSSPELSASNTKPLLKSFPLVSCTLNLTIFTVVYFVLAFRGRLFFKDHVLLLCDNTQSVHLKPLLHRESS